MSVSRFVLHHLAAVAAVSFLLPDAAWADSVSIREPWARATAPGQPAGAVFMGLKADANMILFAAESPAAKVVELHTMKMDNGMMIMRQVPNIALPKGETVTLAPGGLHVMLIGLKTPLQAGQKVAVTLHVRDSQGQEQKWPVQAEIRSGMPSGHHHMH